MADGLRTLVVDDERPVLDELVWLLERDPRIGEIRAVQSGVDALRLLEPGGVDLVFLDIAMPGLSGLELARLLSRFAERPRIVFVTAHDEHAVDAFELGVVDYLLKPVREERLAESVRRATEAGGAPDEDDPTIAVELAGVTRFVRRSSVAYVEAHGDYVRLHTDDGADHLVRVPLTTLAEQWADAGFVRVHRSHLVALRHVTEVRQRDGRTSVVVDTGARTTEISVARRHARALRELVTGRPR